MATCTAKKTGRHKKESAARDCPICAPTLGQMDAIDKKHKRLSEPPAPSRWPEQRNKQRRGHDFYPPRSVKIPQLGETEGIPVADKRVVAHYFVGGSDWWVVEADETTSEAFGFVRLKSDDEMSEWGYFSLQELEQIRVGGTPGGIIERDMYWTPKKVSDASLPRNASR